jgi:SAM-dependent MidA family methyltransferase
MASSASGAWVSVSVLAGDVSAGPVGFDAFMRDALYGERGFYTCGGSAGRRGDFITSPEVGPLFGAVVARALDGWWRELGEPADFTVIEVGAGRGTLARSILAAAPACAPRYVAVEVSAAQRAHHPAGVESLADLPAGPFTGIVIANELLDNLPFRLAVFDGGWREAFVTGDPPAEVLSAPLSPAPGYLPATVPHGSRAPLQDEAASWVANARRSLRRGRVIAFDYAVARTAQLALRPWREWLRTYRDHSRGGHYLAGAGTQDITADVCIDQLAPPDVVRTQAHFLQLHGIAELVAQGRREWGAAAAAPSVRAMVMRSRVREAEALLDPSGLGGFLAMEWEVAWPDNER